MADVNGEMDVEVAKQLRDLTEQVKQHQVSINSVVEGLQQAARGNLYIRHFKDLKEVLASFTETRATLEKAKRLIKARLQEELKES